MKKYLLCLVGILLLSCSEKNYNIYENKEAVFCFIFDDLNQSDTLVKQIFDEYNLKLGFALQTNKLNSQNALIYKQYAEEGISILSHSVSHIKMSDSIIKESGVIKEIVDSKSSIEKYGIEVLEFVTPYSQMNSKYLPYLYPNYEYAFTQIKGCLNKYKLSRYGIESNISDNHDLMKIKNRVDSAIVKKELVVFYGHSLPSKYKDIHGKSRFNESDLREILNYLIENKCKVLSPNIAVLKYYKNE